MKTTKLFIVSCFFLNYSLLFSLPLFAADFYRCGSTFQDTPCAGAVKSKVIGTSSNSNTSQPTKAVDKDCLLQGEAAKKIMWMREIGKTADVQMSTATDYMTKKLIPQVYKLHGSSIEVKAMIEDECMQQKERDLLAAKMMIEAERLRSGTSNVSENNVNTSNLNKSNGGLNDANATNATPNQTSENAAKQLSNNKNIKNTEICSRYQSELNAINVQRKKGGTAIDMETLKLQRTQTEANIKSAGC